MEDCVFWIWLQQALGIGSIKTDWVIRELGSPEKLYQMTEQALAATGRFAPKEIERIRGSSLEEARWQQDRAKRLGCAVVTPDHPAYPASLTNFDCMPCVLYVLGELEGINDELAITMVGTRDCDAYGISTAQHLGCGLATVGATVVSGLAVGIDTAAHEGALQAGGRTIGMLACGMDVGYPQASRRLKRRILDQGGVLISEFPFGVRAYGYHFNVRNRILSGISAGVVVVQAPETSGALNTARHALSQNRDVFAVPGQIFDEKMKGCNRLIADGGKMVLGLASILEEYQGRYPPCIRLEKLSELLEQESRGMVGKIPARVSQKSERPLPAVEKTPTPSGQLEPEQCDLSPEAAKVFQLLNQQPTDFDTISYASGLPVARLLAILTELELADLAEQLPGKRYIRRAP